MPERPPNATSPAWTGPILRVSLLGGFSARIDEQEIAISSAKARALIAFLAFALNHKASRGQIAGTLWSENEEKNARVNLRQDLSKLTRLFEAAGFHGFLTQHSEIVGFAPGSVEFDVFNVIRSISRRWPDDALLDTPHVAETLLIGFETIDPAYDTWLRAQRETLHKKLLRLLQDEFIVVADNRNTESNRIARALWQLDRTHEPTCGYLMRYHADHGDSATATDLYNELFRELGDFHDTVPSDATQALAEQIKAGSYQPRPTRREVITSPALGHARARPDAAGRQGPNSIRNGALAISSTLPSVAKLVISVPPFDISEASEKTHYLAQGFRRELMASLVRFREWVVCDHALTVDRTRGRQYEAEYSIEANAVEAGGELRLVLTLRESGSDAYLWSERLKLSLSNWFQAQDTIVRRLATALNVNVSFERMAAVVQQPPEDLNAYDLWLLGQATLLRWDVKGWDQATRIYREVIDKVPAFAPAHSSLAQLSNGMHIAMPGIFRDRQRTEQALALSREAVRLDPLDSRSQLALGWSCALSKKYEQAEIYMSLASELNENDPWTMIASANCLAFCGELDKARELAKQALQLPFDPSPLQWSYHTAIRFMDGDYQGCLEAAVAAGNDVNPNVPGWKAAALAHLGRQGEAEQQLQEFFTLTRRRWVGDQPPNDENITRWLLHLFPIKRQDDWRRLRDGLALAGAPASAMCHHGW